MIACCFGETWEHMYRLSFSLTSFTSKWFQPGSFLPMGTLRPQGRTLGGRSYAGQARNATCRFYFTFASGQAFSAGAKVDRSLSAPGISFWRSLLHPLISSLHSALVMIKET